MLNVRSDGDKLRLTKLAISHKDWESVDKSKLPAACFLIVGDRAKKATWKLPVYEGAGGVDPESGMYRQRGALNANAVRAARAAVGGARTGEAMSVPAGVKAKLDQLMAAVQGEGKEE